MESIDLLVLRTAQEWLAKGYHGSMEWLAAHGNKRSRPAELLPGTVRVRALAPIIKVMPSRGTR